MLCKPEFDVHKLHDDRPVFYNCCREVVIDASALKHGYPVQNYAIIAMKSSHKAN